MVFLREDCVTWAQRYLLLVSPGKWVPRCSVGFCWFQSSHEEHLAVLSNSGPLGMISECHLRLPVYWAHWLFWVYFWLMPLGFSVQTVMSCPSNKKKNKRTMITSFFLMKIRTDANGNISHGRVCIFEAWPPPALLQTDLESKCKGSGRGTATSMLLTEDGPPAPWEGHPLGLRSMGRGACTQSRAERRWHHSSQSNPGL